MKKEEDRKDRTYAGPVVANGESPVKLLVSRADAKSMTPLKGQFGSSRKVETDECKPPSWSSTSQAYDCFLSRILDPLDKFSGYANRPVDLFLIVCLKESYSH